MAIVSVDGYVDISINVFDRLPSMGGGMDPSVSGKVADIMDDLTAELREYIIDNWPVDTGRSQQLWSIQWDSPTWVIRNPVEYAAFVHPKDDETLSWEGVEEESEYLLSAALSDLGALVSQSAVTTLERAVRMQQGVAARLARVASRGLRASLFAATVVSFRDVPSRQREQIARERQRVALRNRTRAR